MATEHLILFSIPGLRPGDVDQRTTPTLYAWANGGALAEMTPTFPCVTSCVQASIMTGAPPGEHGVIANGFYNRDRREVEFWVGRNDVIAGERIWEAISARRANFTSAVWHAQNIKGAAADFIVTPAPIHEPDGTMKPWCYSKPDGLYQQLLDDLGHFPLQHYWGPLANIESTRWILKAARRLIDTHQPNFHWIYLPHLDYASQEHGPDSPQAKAAVSELDECLAEFAGVVGSSAIGDDVVYLAVGEYALTEVTGVVYPNRLLREVGLLNIERRDGAEYVDFATSPAFAMVDHQFAHVYVYVGAGLDRAERGRMIAKVVDVFSGLDGIADVVAGEDRARFGIVHERAGDVVVVCDEAHWLAYYWWIDDANAPPFARTVDIHRKPGYDPVELFFEPATKGIPLDATLVKGSHGAVATHANQRTALICSAASSAVRAGGAYRDTDLKQISLALLGL